MKFAIGESTDTQENPALMWSDSRREIQSGTLTIETVSPEAWATIHLVILCIWFSHMVKKPSHKKT